jgi:hypothetical protein
MHISNRMSTCLGGNIIIYFRNCLRISTSAGRSRVVKIEVARSFNASPLRYTNRRNSPTAFITSDPHAVPSLRPSAAPRLTAKV